MRLLVDIEIPKNKISFFINILGSFSFIKVKQATEEKTLLISEIKEAVENLNLVTAGKLEVCPIEELLDEL